MEEIDWEYLTRYGKTFHHGQLVEACGSVWKIIGRVRYVYKVFNGTENVYKVKRVKILEPNPFCSRPANLGDITLFSSWILNKFGDVYGKTENKGDLH